ncbi:glyoxalase superfamily protein [Paenibacillus sp. HB172176]|uniref:glyoxalase superfamily protein n=1 Tax=Paenibacillus sp. HB172176 TaxID=2493690 RepID=UPI001F113EDC|nr:glyoxalase superfamily protein [Paenibacillus sp. HB172176]
MTTLHHIIPLLRIFDEAKAKDFYLDYLGFQLDFEHRFEPGLPLYMQVSRDGLRIHLTEHYGDACPGSAVRIEVSGVRELQRELIAKRHGFSRPGLVETPWGSEEVRLIDPFGNRIVFFEDKE